MANKRPIPGRVTFSTDMNSAYVDAYWSEIEGMTEQVWLSYSPAKRYESCLNHLAAQATMARKLAQRDQDED